MEATSCQLKIRYENLQDHEIVSHTVKSCVHLYSQLIYVLSQSYCCVIKILLLGSFKNLTYH